MPDSMADIVKGTLGIGRGNRWKDLWDATVGYTSDAPCTHQPLSYRLSDWWGDYRPRWPKWDITVYEWHEDKPNTDEEYRFLFEHYELPYRVAKTLERELPRAYTEFPLTVVRKFSWA
ncbi:hypothetical protein SEA_PAULODIABOLI_204 [Microbacterium phage PauloDiaboli]|nr:hypothetical protein SEA_PAULODIABOLI_204 [Microbacterium phage PauloDiaboli]QWY84012.1 hypothetical protein SEA_A3WALLY_205 [Microbacterium phage A3Wally]